MSELDNVLQKYKKLSTWCEQFYERVFNKFSNDIACHAGCDICCELKSVNLIEAYAIVTSGVLLRTPVNNGKNGKCVFLVDDKCSIYEFRPLICRTHGLAIKSREFTTEYSVTCPYNFNETDPVKHPEMVLDMDYITENIVRLNHKFCRITHLEHLSSERILFSDLVQKKFTPETERVFLRAYE